MKKDCLQEEQLAAPEEQHISAEPEDLEIDKEEAKDVPESFVYREDLGLGELSGAPDTKAVPDVAFCPDPENPGTEETVPAPLEGAVTDQASLSDDESMVEDSSPPFDEKGMTEKPPQQEADWRPLPRTAYGRTATATKRRQEETVEWTKAILGALVLALLIRTFVFAPLVVPTGSMIPTIEIGDRIYVNKLAYRLGEPKVGDVVVFKYPDDPSQTFVKRLLGVGGDELFVEDFVLHRNGEPVGEPYLLEPMHNNSGPFEVPPDHFFMLGDNRNSSQDSRYWKNSYVPRDLLVGRICFRYWPLHRIGRVK